MLISSCELPPQDNDGHAVIIALGPISKGKEVMSFLVLVLIIQREKNHLSGQTVVPPADVLLHRCRSPSPTSTKNFRTRSGRRSSRTTDSHVPAPSARRKSPTEQQGGLDLLQILVVVSRRRASCL